LLRDVRPLVHRLGKSADLAIVEGIVRVGLIIWIAAIAPGIALRLALVMPDLVSAIVVAGPSTLAKHVPTGRYEI
jgi:hypothetical protein